MPDQPQSGCDSLRLPLVLGVTGHRDLRAEDLPQLTARLDQFLEALKRRCPSTPLVLLSSLAEGADRLVAKVALRHQAELIAPLPLPPEQCLEDFKSPASKAEFQELLQRASGWFVVPTPEEVADAGTPEGRDRCYEQMGAFIAARCQFLIALWNGEFNQLRGGTGHIVQMCREGIPTPWVIRDSALDFPEKRTLVWIVTPRQGNPTTARPAFEITPDPAKFPGDIRRLCELTDGYNRDLARHPSAGQASVEVLEPANSSLAGQALQVAEQLLAKSLAQADTLAVLYARRTRKLLAGILMLTFCAAVAYQLLATQWFGRYWTQGPGAAGESALMPLRLAYAGLLLGILACYLFSIRTNYHCKYLDYRALAEGLRVQWFWCGARIAEPVADHYLRKQRGLLDWLQTALRATVVLCEGRSGCSLRALLEQRPVPLELMLSKWVDDQRHYYRQQASKHQRSAQRLRLVWQTTVIAGVLLGILKAGKGLQNGWDLNDHPLVVLVVLATAAIGLWKIQSKTNANSEMAKQFAHMSQVFDEASRLIRASLDRGDLAAARELMRELGKEALAEHGEWLLLHRQRPIELPKA